MNILKSILYEATHKRNLYPRVLLSFLAVETMGISMALLIKVNFGTDPCTLMNVAISNTLGISLGNWQAIMNSVLCVIVLIFGARNIGFGSLFNMFLVGYTIDFCRWAWGKIIPQIWFEQLSTRIMLLIPALFVFLIACAIYNDVDMGTGPYDAIPFLIHSRLKKVSFRTIRMTFDFAVTLIGVLFGGRAGILTILMVLLLGPMISGVGTYLEKHVRIFQEL